jgi:hypothetical protein
MFSGWSHNLGSCLFDKLLVEPTNNFSLPLFSDCDLVGVWLNLFVI